MGCLGERFREELTAELPEVDKIYGKRRDIGGCGKLLRLLEGILTRRAVEDEKYFVWGVGNYLRHDTLDFRELVHQAHLVV